MEQIDQSRVVTEVLDTQTREMPTVGRYLALSDAVRIVDDTIDHVARRGDALTFRYLSGHKRRLATTLTMIPFADKPDAACLDVGCFGYMAYWAYRHLGYARVEGIEWRPDNPEKTEKRQLKVGNDELEFTVHNFNLTKAEWPSLDTFDTVLFLETLEHLDVDPMCALLHVADRLTPDGVLVISVPNCVSYKGLQEFISGMPPWTYWFYHPDLGHEPRHCFEYTPTVLRILLRCAGLRESAFRSIYAYADSTALQDILAVGAALSFDEKMFGDTLIAQARRDTHAQIIRYPDCIYDGDRYYRSTYPAIAPVLQSRLERVLAALSLSEQQRNQLEAAEDQIAQLRNRLGSAERRCDELQNKLEAAAGQSAELQSKLDAQQDELSFALLTCETLFARCERAELERSAARNFSGVWLAQRMLALGEREVGKLLCTLGYKKAGEKFWNRAASRAEGSV